MATYVMKYSFFENCEKMNIMIALPMKHVNYYVSGNQMVSVCARMCVYMCMRVCVCQEGFHATASTGENRGSGWMPGRSGMLK